MELSGLAGGPPRPPLSSVSDEESALIERLIGDLNAG
jgi:hypothetical protein